MLRHARTSRQISKEPHEIQPSQRYRWFSKNDRSLMRIYCYQYDRSTWLLLFSETREAELFEYGTQREWRVQRSEPARQLLIDWKTWSTKKLESVVDIIRLGVRRDISYCLLSFFTPPTKDGTRMLFSRSSLNKSVRREKNKVTMPWPIEGVTSRVRCDGFHYCVGYTRR